MHRAALIWVEVMIQCCQNYIMSYEHAVSQHDPGIHIHVFSGHAEDVTERIDRGLLDFGIFVEPADMTKYDFIELPYTDIWGLLMRRDSPLSEKEAIKPNDLYGLFIIASSEALNNRL